MHIRRGALAPLFAAALLLGACGGGNDNDGAAAATDDTTAKAPSNSGGGVPDACSVFRTADVTAAFGGEPGVGKPSGGGSRRVCTFAAGTIVGVSEANQYDGSLSLAKTNGSTCADTSGVGDKAAFCNVYGQVGQLFWVKGNLMYDISAATVDEVKFKSLAARIT